MVRKRILVREIIKEDDNAVAVVGKLNPKNTHKHISQGNLIIKGL